VATLHAEVRCPWAGQRAALTRSIALPSIQGATATAVAALAWEPGSPRTNARRSNWTPFAPRTTASRAAWIDARTRRTVAAHIAWADYPPRTRAGIVAWGNTDPQARHYRRRAAAWRQGDPLTRRGRLDWMDVLRVRPERKPAPPACYQPPPIDAISFALTCDYTSPQHGRSILIDYRYADPAPLPRALDVQPRAVWADAVPSHSRRRVVWGKVSRVGRDYAELAPEDGAPWDTEIPRLYLLIRPAHMILHDISLTRVSDGAAIPCSAFTLAADADAWAETLSATVHGDDAMDLLTATVGTELELDIDGAVWRLIVAPGSTRETLAHGNRAVSLTAYSLTSLLHTPHQDPADYTETSTRSAAQLADDALPDGAGWTLLWQVGRPLDTPVDWTVPAGVWTYRDLTPIQAIARVAASVGAVVIPSQAARTLTVRSRYPVLPWDYATTTPALTVPDGVWLTAERRHAAPRQANAVYLTGGALAGVQGRVYRTGTAGDLYAPDPGARDLLTHADALREAGAQILAAHAAQSQIRAITIPYDGGTDWPLLGIGDLILVERYGGQRDTVMTRAITATITDRTVDVRQTATLGADTGSAYTRLRRVTSDVAPLLLAAITTDHGDGTATVTYASGGTQRVLGSGTAGTTVWVQSGAIRSTAPTLPAFDLPV
jgi:hypothetical protein